MPTIYKISGIPEEELYASKTKKKRKKYEKKWSKWL